MSRSLSTSSARLLGRLAVMTTTHRRLPAITQKSFFFLFLDEMPASRRFLFVLQCLNSASCFSFQLAASPCVRAQLNTRPHVAFGTSLTWIRNRVRLGVLDLKGKDSNQADVVNGLRVEFSRSLKELNKQSDTDVALTVNGLRVEFSRSLKVLNKQSDTDVEL